MSANNWMVCPKCESLAIQKKEAAMIAAGESYGKVSSQEYLSSLEAANKPLALEETFREDYEVGMCDDGEFYVSYSGVCTECGFTHSFKHSEQVLKVEAPQ